MRVFSTLLLALSLTVTLTAQTHPFSVQDMLAMDRISDPQVSPDGRSVVFAVRATDLAANRGLTELWLVGTDGTGLGRLTSHAASDVNPRWAPDGKTIYFLSTRSGSSQIWQIAVDGGEPSQVTTLPLDAGSFRISPDGTRIAFSAEVFPGKSIDETVKMLDERSKTKASGKVFDS